MREDERRRIIKKKKMKMIRRERNDGGIDGEGGNDVLLGVEGRSRRNWSWMVRGRRVATGGE